MKEFIHSFSARPFSGYWEYSKEKADKNLCPGNKQDELRISTCV